MLAVNPSSLLQPVWALFRQPDWSNFIVRATTRFGILFIHWRTETHLLNFLLCVRYCAKCWESRSKIFARELLQRESLLVFSVGQFFLLWNVPSSRAPCLAPAAYWIQKHPQALQRPESCPHISKSIMGEQEQPWMRGEMSGSLGVREQNEKSQMGAK